MKRSDMISPFMGALMDCVNAEVSTRPITTMFTDYVDIMRVVRGISNHMKCNEV